MTEQRTAHHITFGDSPGSVRVVFNGETIAETQNAIILKEGAIPPVYYIPPEDVRQDVLTKTDRITHCPFKGDASYWSIQVGDKVSENSIWVYEQPFDQVSQIKGHMAFYSDRMDSFETE